MATYINVTDRDNVWWLYHTLQYMR